MKCIAIQEVAADKLDSEGDKRRDQEKAKHQKRFYASSDEKAVGIIRTCMQNEKLNKIQRRNDGDDGGNRGARKTMQRMDG